MQERQHCRRCEGWHSRRCIRLLQHNEYAALIWPLREQGLSTPLLAPSWAALSTSDKIVVASNSAHAFERTLRSRRAMSTGPAPL